MNTIDITYSIDPKLYRRATTQPIRARNRTLAIVRNLVATACTLGMLAALNIAIFEGKAIVPLCVGFVLGAIVVVAVWWRQHRTLVKVHERYNDSGGILRFAADSEGIVVCRPGIESRVSWSLVRDVHLIEGAILIELPTARVILPEIALEGIDKAQLVSQLNSWRGIS